MIIKISATQTTNWIYTLGLIETKHLKYTQLAFTVYFQFLMCSLFCLPFVARNFSSSVQQNSSDYILLCIKIRFVQRNLHVDRDSRIRGKSGRNFNQRDVKRILQRRMSRNRGLWGNNCSVLAIKSRQSPQFSVLPFKFTRVCTVPNIYPLLFTRSRLLINTIRGHSRFLLGQLFRQAETVWL